MDYRKLRADFNVCLFIQCLDDEKPKYDLVSSGGEDIDVF
ncbi:hypothetical protein PPEP_a1151 [Pseudoalteromonas peptidolytica F12-50-A1]|uniref:Uncharacterized protein n=1 Tax=Pseudoalteromonas peptidolytica F12-50-A1 TaxID=1315280 RepID=A0A8I0MVH5_9GAMM|nr:hypothetical protein [Pseudoalteromonas peptidolytica F12-50-A1]